MGSHSELRVVTGETQENTISALGVGWGGVLEPASRSPGAASWDL